MRDERPARTIMRATLGFPAMLLVLVAGLTACLPVPGDTRKVEFVASRTVDGWRYDYYRNRAYPCSIDGYQTFAIGRRVGSSDIAPRPLWVRMRGGGAGYFAEDGTPKPTAGNKSEITLDALLKFDSPGLMADVKAAAEGFRVLLVSMCSHDVYGGLNTPDPNNPNVTPEGAPRRTNGLISVKAAIQYTQENYPTDDYLLHGTSAGSAGAFHVAWALQQQRIPPTGVVADSGIIDQAWERDVVDQGTCGDASLDRRGALLARIDPAVGDVDNQPDLLVSRGALIVPVMHVWNHGDLNTCGQTPMVCSLRDGTTVALGASDCHHENMRRAIAAQGPTSRSRNLAVCVEGASASQACDLHVVTTRENGVNTDPGQPADYQAAILGWVRARLADDRGGG